MGDRCERFESDRTPKSVGREAKEWAEEKGDAEMVEGERRQTGRRPVHANAVRDVNCSKAYPSNLIDVQVQGQFGHCCRTTVTKKAVVASAFREGQKVGRAFAMSSQFERHFKRAAPN
jgi:hypothetical protein